jgi:hypothetical protein
MKAKASNIPIDIILQKEIKANILTSIATEVAGAVKRCDVNLHAKMTPLEAKVASNFDPSEY